MKKLFTTLLMLGVFGLSWAVIPPAEKVSITSFSDGVLTVNYDKTKQGPEMNKEMIERVLKEWIRTGLNVQGNDEALRAAAKANVSTIKLTGDWENTNLAKDQNTIFTLIDWCADENGVGLDLSACQGFQCKFISVTDDYDPVNDNDSVVFTYGPITSSETIRTLVTITEHKVEVQEVPRTHPVTYVHNEVTVAGTSIPVVDNEVTIEENRIPVRYVNEPVIVDNNAIQYTWDRTVVYPELGSEGLPSWANPNDYSFSQNPDGTWVIIQKGENWQNVIPLSSTPVTTYSYKNEDGDDVTQYNTNGLRQDGENWYYTKYIYTDQYGNLQKSQSAPTGLVQNGDDYYIPNGYNYSYQDENGNVVTVNDLYGFRQDANGNYWYTRYYYSQNDGEQPTWKSEAPQNLVKVGEDEWIIPTSYSYTDENGVNRTVTSKNEFMVEENGTLYYTCYAYQDQWSQHQRTLDPSIFITNEDGDYEYAVGTYYCYTDKDGVEQEQADTQGLVQENGKYYYVYTTYDYTDKNGDEISTPYRYDPYNLIEADGKLYYEYTLTEGAFSFEGYAHMLSSVSFPNNPDFDFIPGSLMQSANALTSITLPEGIKAIGNHAFASATKLATANFPSTLQEIGGGAFENTRLTEVDLSNTQIKKIRFCTFMKNPALQYCYYPTCLEMISYNAFIEDRGLLDVDLSDCHNLTFIGHKAYEECEALLSVKVCAHPKTIQGGHGSGAFYNCKEIKTVEIVMNERCNITDITKCVCEYGAFDADETYDQTVADLEQIDKTTARLIFPEDAPVDPATGYTSAWDFFVGDYKAGKLIKQESLENYYKDVPWSVTDNPGFATDAKTHETIGGTRYSANGWLEFINTGHGVVITPEPDPSTEDKYTFLRTYSRSKGDGPVLLPREVIAYRAIDYGSTKWEMVENPEGTYYKPDENVDEYELIPEGKEPEVRYSRGLTIGGQILLRPLKAKVAEEGKNPNVYADYITLQDKTETYTTEEGVYGYWLSYVPENTGVVLYSTNISENMFLIMKEYTEDDLVLKEYPNTGQCYKGDGTIQDQEDRINMLEGSYDEVTNVAPVFPWNWDKGTYYKDDRQYRNFGFNKSLKRWIRLKVGQLRLNRAFAQVPASRFDNFNESDQQQPDFTFEDEINDLENSQYQIALGLSFEDENTEIDGIKTVNTNSNVKVNDDAWYTLQGVKVNKPVRGVYIHNNQKVVIK